MVTNLQGLFLLLLKVIFFVEHLMFIKSYYRGCLLFTEARPFWPMMLKIIPRLFIDTIFNCLRRFLFSHLGFCILRASISFVYQWSINFKVHKTILMSENIQSIVFEVLNSKMPKSLIFLDFWVFLPQSGKNVFSWHSWHMSTCLILKIKGPLFSTLNSCSQDAKI